MKQLTFAQIGVLYNGLTKRVVGGLSQSDVKIALIEINIIQTQLQNLIDEGALSPLGAVSVVHAQNVVDQLNFLKQEVKDFGTDPFAPKFINDIIRDVQDIVQGDSALADLASSGGVVGFAQVSRLLTPPAPFPDTPLQTQTLLKFVDDSNSLASRATALAGVNSANPNVQTLIHDIQSFSIAADAYSTAQGGLFSARFNNEFTLNGVQGTASRKLVAGLKSGDASLVNGAAEVLVENATDVRTNMLASGDTYVPPPNGGIPALIDTIQVAGQVFNDAVTKLIGGVSPSNQVSVEHDLSAVIVGLQKAISHENITGRSLWHVNFIINLVQNELNLVTSITIPQQVSQVADQIGAVQAIILGTVQRDAKLVALSSAHDPSNPGFAPLH